ncbi:hypothetical protein ACJRO7_007463 [Eucalyptus globulus]|uniref:non-specific serine/threonine protein kinase n=1 Tax=Eucalyptus globulus TaxID=34317 RepID=A0ABD3IN70_EUCGL
MFNTRPGSSPPASPPSSLSFGKSRCNFVRSIVKGEAAPSVSSCPALPSQLPWWRRVLKRQPGDSSSNCMPSEEDLERHLGLVRRFSLREVQLTTNNFARVLGESGFSTVYKGSLVAGSLVAVKRLLLTELKVSSIVKHRNVLSLLGFCIIPTELFLIISVKSLGTSLEWSVRISVATRVAKALAYLHEDCDPKIIHRDIKASNVLLDEKYLVALSDFGLAVLMDYEEICVESNVAGTHGHVDPEYFITGICSTKTDVYAYGVMLLKVITGRSILDLARLANDCNVFEWVKSAFDERNLDVLIDRSLQGKYVEEEMLKLVKLAIACTERSPWRRPEGNAYNFSVE